MIGPSQRPLRDNTQHSQETNIHAPGWDSNPQSLQASGRRPSSSTSRPLGLVQNIIKHKEFYVLPTQCICVFCVYLRTDSGYFIIIEDNVFWRVYCNSDVDFSLQAIERPQKSRTASHPRVEHLSRNIIFCRVIGLGSNPRCHRDIVVVSVVVMESTIANRQHHP